MPGMEPRPILIVDDEPAIRRLWSRILTGAGYRVVCAADALEAERALDEHRPAVAICDVHLNGASGLWVAELVRGTHPSTAIILVSGDPMVSPCDTLSPSVVAYLLKPVLRVQLLDTVEQALAWVHRHRPL
jgi:CheY-like chemotaxis protein